ncbi:hypothetical protein [Polyangium aurulentum]|uniref:hypothetical protein n=1 Tax=Polyangium aurulentum TaxID=2567896 RepID=UPI0010AEEA35|nr:hypothetical protein [Polyangium aurulentum]UQA62819.1 hypothetical protein E8A73_021150 [Polyangium aurulentum]
MTARKTTPRRFGAALFALTLTGCAQVIGIEDFTLTGGPGGGGEPVDVCNEVHGCTREMAENWTALSTITVNFGASGFETPCILARAGMSVTFDAGGFTFEQVPIAGGVYPTEDPDSPIKNPVPGNMSTASFTLGSDCSYPYFLQTTAETGVIFIQ